MGTKLANESEHVKLPLASSTTTDMNGCLLHDRKSTLQFPKLFAYFVINEPNKFSFIRWMHTVHVVVRFSSGFVHFLLSRIFIWKFSFA